MDDFIVHENLVPGHSLQRSTPSMNTPEPEDLAILLPVINDKVVIFDLEDIKRLRNVGVLGILIGTLAKAPQQNLFLGVPLELSTNEVIWLVEKDLGVLVDNLKYNQWLLRQSEPQISNKRNEIALVRAVTSGLKLSEEQLKRKLEASEAGTMIVTRNCLGSETPIPDDILVPIDQFLARVSGSKVLANYKAYRDIRAAGFYILPGIRFGGDFVAYPGDPLKFHSHLIVKVVGRNDKINCMDMVTGGRLATSVKKVWCVTGEVEDLDDNEEGLYDKMVRETKRATFSIEWAGFG